MFVSRGAAVNASLSAGNYLPSIYNPSTIHVSSARSLGVVIMRDRIRQKAFKFLVVKTGYNLSAQNQRNLG